jgi:hypothetical protein
MYLPLHFYAFIRSKITKPMIKSIIILTFIAELNYSSAISAASLVDSDAEISEVMYTYGFEVTGTPADIITTGDKLLALWKRSLNSCSQEQ